MAHHPPRTCNGQLDLLVVPTLWPPMWEQRNTCTESLSPASCAASSRRRAKGSPSAPHRASRLLWQHLWPKKPINTLFGFAPQESLPHFLHQVQ